MNVNLFTLSPNQHTKQNVLMVPLRAAPDGDAVWTAGGRAYPAVRGRTLGSHSVEFRVRCPNGAGLGTLEATTAPSEPYHPGAWVPADPTKVVQALIVDAADVAPSKTEVLWTDQASRHYRVTFVRDGLWCWLYLQTGARDNSIEWQVVCGFSSPATPDMQRTFQRIAIKFNQLAICDDVSNRVTHKGSGGMDYVELIPGPTTIGDGQCITPVRGAVLCLPTDVGIGALLGSGSAEVLEQIRNLYGRIAGPTFGWAADWSGHALCFGEVPVVNSLAMDSMRAEAVRIMTQRGLWDARPRAQAPNANQTGGQAEFGAIEGTELWRGHGISLPWLLWNASHEALRPTHFREADGTRVMASAHPDWKTWSQRTHYSASQSLDRLGKPVPEPWFETHGWKGEDEEHATCNLLAAVYALTGDYVLRDLLLDDIECERASVRYDQHAFGASRAAGRRGHANALRYILTGSPTSLETIQDLIGDIVETWAGRNGGSIRPLATIEAGTYLRDPDTGEPWECVSVWEHGIAAMGLHALANVLPTISSALAHVIRSVGELIIQHGFFREDGTWKCAEILHYHNGGDAIPPSYYLNGGKDGWVKVTGTFLPWITHVAKWVAAHPDYHDAATVSRAVEIRDWWAALPETRDQDKAEWWAVGQ